MTRGAGDPRDWRLLFGWGWLQNLHTRGMGKQRQKASNLPVAQHPEDAILHGSDTVGKQSGTRVYVEYSAQSAQPNAPPPPL